MADSKGRLAIRLKPSGKKLRLTITGLLMSLTLVVSWQALESKAPIAISDPSGPTLDVVEVYDGDTIAVLLNGQKEKVRLIGVDTPETHDPRKVVQCFGREASDWTKKNLQNRRVRLEADPSQGERDKYDRMLAYVWRDDGLFINQALVSEGYAHEYTYGQVAYKYQANFKLAQDQAEAKQLGLWSPSTCGGDTLAPAK